MADEREYDEAFIFLAPGSDPSVDRVAVASAGTASVFVWAPDAAAAARTADELAEGGVRLIELYRGFDLASAGQVIDAVGGRSPVGVAGLVGPGRSVGLPIRRSATIYGRPDADPAGERVMREHGGGAWTVVVGAPDSAYADLAAELVDRGAELVEICGGTPLTTAARVSAAVGKRVPVTLVAWPFESIDGVAAYKAAFEAAQS